MPQASFFPRFLQFDFLLGEKSKSIGKIKRYREKSKSVQKIKRYRGKIKKCKEKSNCIKDSVYIEEGLAEITLKPGDEKEIAFYQITDSFGKPLADGEKRAMGEPFLYLSLLAGQAGDMKVNLFDSQGEFVETGVFREETACVVAE